MIFPPSLLTLSNHVRTHDVKTCPYGEFFERSRVWPAQTRPFCKVFLTRFCLKSCYRGVELKIRGAEANATIDFHCHAGDPLCADQVFHALGHFGSRANPSQSVEPCNRVVAIFRFFCGE